MQLKPNTKIASLISRLTGKARYTPELELSKDSFVFSAFRLLESVIGRQTGVRRESLVRAFEDEEGNFVVERKFFTLEAFLCYAESVVRTYASKAFEPRPEFGFLPQPVFLTLVILGMKVSLSGDANGMIAPLIGMAIARDNYSGAFLGGSTNSHTISHTVSGSNRLLLIGSYAGTNGTTVSSMTYAGNGTTYIDRGKYNANSSWVYVHYQTAPATGANNVVVSFNQNCYKGTVAASYSGVDQTTPINASGNTSTTNTNNLTKSLTSTVDNCWGVAFMEGSNCDPALITVNNLLSFEMAEQGDGVYAADTNGSVGSAGSKTMGWTQSTGSNLNGMVAVLIAPAAASQNSAFLQFMA